MTDMQDGTQSKIPLAVATAPLVLAFLFVPFVLATQSAQAQTYSESVLYSFAGGTDAAQPNYGLLLDAKGILYGTTFLGGTSSFGTVFKVNKKGKETVLHSFSGPDGEYPYAGPIRDSKGNLYGTAVLGGSSGLGTVFQLTKAGVLTVLYNFSGPDGEYPYAGLISDGNGNFFGTTFLGGTSGLGTVYTLDKTGKETVLYSFTGGADGQYPYAGLIQDAKGNFYGTTQAGGPSGFGTVFELDTTGKETVLYSFTGPDGEYPYAGLIRDSKGNLYGTTYNGGAFGFGTVFKVGTTGKETVLYSFTGGADGAGPYFAGVLRDKTGNMYGTTSSGGASNHGTVFKLNKKGKETVLHSFTGGTDGETPYASLVRDAAGNLYGDTYLGGAFNLGTVFKLTR